jgi:Domain of unknown function (DUF397)
VGNVLKSPRVLRQNRSTSAVATLTLSRIIGREGGGWAPMSAVAWAEGVSGDGDNSGREWRRSSRSYGGGNCVEAAPHHGALIDIRDSKNPDGAVLRFASVEWNAFVAGVRSGELGL